MVLAIVKKKGYSGKIKEFAFFSTLRERNHGFGHVRANKGY